MLNSRYTANASQLDPSFQSKSIGFESSRSPRNRDIKLQKAVSVF